METHNRIHKIYLTNQSALRGLTSTLLVMLILQMLSEIEKELEELNKLINSK